MDAAPNILQCDVTPGQLEDHTVVQFDLTIVPLSAFSYPCPYIQDSPPDWPTCMISPAFIESLSATELVEWETSLVIHAIS